jgi:hypothetical protein
MTNVRPASLDALSAEVLTPDGFGEGGWAIAGFDLTLRQALGPDRHLRARCGCGRHGPIDPSYWVARRLHDRPLEDLADQVRCPCGSTSASLEVAAGPMAPGAAFLIAA